MKAPVMVEAKFERGRMMMTRGIAELVNQTVGAFAVVSVCLRRHLSGDCGDMGAEDVASNQRAIEDGDERVFSAYETQFGRIWIITEADRSATTVLFPEEY